eukprot:gene12263-15409_t
MKRQDMRDELEMQVSAMSLQKDMMEADMGNMTNTVQQIHSLSDEVVQLRHSLTGEMKKVKRYRELRSVFESQLGEFGEQLALIMEHHTQVSSDLQQERDSFAHKAKKSIRKLSSLDVEVQHLRSQLASMTEELQDREVAFAELQDPEVAFAELQDREVAFAEVKASAEMLQHASTQMHDQAKDTQRELESHVEELHARNEELIHQNYQLKSALEESEGTVDVSMKQNYELKSALEESEGTVDVSMKQKYKLKSALEESEGTVDVSMKQKYKLKSALEESEGTVDVSMKQVKELSGRCDFLRTEREKLVNVLKNEQSQVSAWKQSAEGMRKKIEGCGATRRLDGD